MNVHVTVDLDGDTLVALKTATGAEAVDRLRHEATRLSDARHPGVVALVSCRDLEPAVPSGGGAPTPSCELRTAYAGEPVTRWTGSVADVGGLAASVASTLADLHDLGIVHGRLEASHVLLGDGGRPRLCGWAGLDGAGAADDVAAWGRLVDGLLARAASPRRGLRAARGGGPGARRALAALVERSTDPVPTRRPSMRALADMVMTAVPAAALPDAGGPCGAVRSPAYVPAAAPTRPEGDTLDRIWSYAGEPSEDERWAAAFGRAPADVEIASPPDLPYAAVDALDWAAPPFDDETDRAPSAGVRRDGQPPDRARLDGDHHDAEAPGRPRYDDHSLDDAPTERLPYDDLDDERTERLPHDLHDERTDRLRYDALDDAGDHGDPSAFDDAAGVSDATDHQLVHDDRTRDHVPVGLRSPVVAAPVERASGRRRRHVAVAGITAVIVLGAAALVGPTIARGSGSDADASRPAADLPDCPAATPPAADVDGDGCREALVVDGSTVDAGVARWTLGEPGDLVTVGDWDCDGEASAALLRPASGDVFLFTAWAALDQPVTVTPADRVTGGAAIRAEADGSEPPCDRLVVDTAAGGSTTVAVPE